MKSEFHTETNYVNIGPLNQKAGRELTEQSIVHFVEELNKALHLFPEAEHLTIHYRNILERECNPNGDMGFFQIISRWTEEPQLSPHLPPVKRAK